LISASRLTLITFEAFIDMNFWVGTNWRKKTELTPKKPNLRQRNRTYAKKTELTPKKPNLRQKKPNLQKNRILICQTENIFSVKNNN